MNGSARTRAGLAAVGAGGTAVLAGIGSPAATTVVPIFDVLQVVAMLPRLPVEKLSSHSVTRARIPDALELLRSGKAIKVVVVEL